MKKLGSLILSTLLLVSSQSFADPAPLVGTWLLDHSEDTMPDGSTVPYCTGAHGLIVYTAEGYVSVALNCAATGNGPEPADATGRKFFYAGTYRYDGTHVTHHLLNSSQPEMIGESFTRSVAIQGDELILAGVSLGQPFSAYWKKVKP